MFQASSRLASSGGSSRLPATALRLPFHYTISTWNRQYRTTALCNDVAQDYDTICEMAASNLRFGPGATSEIGFDLKHNLFPTHSATPHVVVFTDPNVRQMPVLDTLLESFDRADIRHVTLYDQCRVEPNDVSFQHAIRFLRSLSYDAVVAVGGGSVIDTAKAANLYATYPEADFYDFVNPPIGKGRNVPMTSSLPPLVAIPTTAGTGSETTGVAIFDDTATHSKTGIASRQLKPVLGIVDPNNTETLPTKVATYSGLDVLCHAIESYTALPYNKRPRPESPILRPTYQGSNPFADHWSLFALRTCARYLPEAIDPKRRDTIEARTKMLLASSAAGMGFGNAGVHLCHGMSYPISSQAKEYYGYERTITAIEKRGGQDGLKTRLPHDNASYDTLDLSYHPLVPHGLSVIVSAPAVFEFTGEADPERHSICARILSEARGDNSKAESSYRDAGAWLADEIRQLCNRLQVPLGLRQFGYSEDDIPSLVEGTLPQHRVVKICPRQPIGRQELECLFLAAMDEKQD